VARAFPQGVGHQYKDRRGPMNENQECRVTLVLGCDPPVRLDVHDAPEARVGLNNRDSRRDSLRSCIRFASIWLHCVRLVTKRPRRKRTYGAPADATGVTSQIRVRALSPGLPSFASAHTFHSKVHWLPEQRRKRRPGRLFHEHERRRRARCVQRVVLRERCSEALGKIGPALLGKMRPSLLQHCAHNSMGLA
jgi:hypothetical protein